MTTVARVVIGAVPDVKVIFALDPLVKTGSVFRLGYRLAARRALFELRFDHSDGSLGFSRSTMPIIGTGKK